MNKAQRQHQLNITADAIFSGGISDDEYERIRERAHYRPCAWCGDEYRWTLQSYTGPKNSKGNDQHCSRRCLEQAERHNAPLIRPQPKGETFENWDI